MSKKNKKKQKNLESKALMGSQIELMQIKIRAFNQVIQLMEQRKNDINNSVNKIALELGVPEEQLGEWGLAEDGETLIKIGKQRRFPGYRTVKKREKKKKKGESQQPEKEG